MRLWIQLLIAFFLVSTGHAQTPKHLWVLQGPDGIAEYDLASFAARRTIKVPRRVPEKPEYLSINSKGEMLFQAPSDMEWAGGEMASAGHRVWFWDGKQAREWALGVTRTGGRRESRPLITETRTQCFLSAGGERFFWLENRFEKATDESGLELSVVTTSRVWQSDLFGNRAEEISSLSFPRCQCKTGACSETCPEMIFWAPAGVVSDFFLLTSFTPGQIGSTFHETLLYQRTGKKWLAKKLARPVERPLDGSDRGEILVAAVPDAGCCGWENDSRDQMLLLRKGRGSVLYDEFERYQNSDYDVSFYTADARLSPGKGRVAYTIVSTARAGSEIRLSSGGKENREKLARVRKGIGETPLVEIVPWEGKPQPEAVIHRASLVGWLSEGEILIAKDGRLLIYDIRRKEETAIKIQVRSAADAFLR
jgi:hypothetical protein